MVLKRKYCPTCTLIYNDKENKNKVLEIIYKPGYNELENSPPRYICFSYLKIFTTTDYYFDFLIVSGFGDSFLKQSAFSQCDN